MTAIYFKALGHFLVCYFPYHIEPEIFNGIRSRTGRPNIARVKEIAEKEILLREMNMKLLEKIEELTLYVLQHDNKNKELLKKYGRLMKKISV